MKRTRAESVVLTEELGPCRLWCEPVQVNPFRLEAWNKTWLISWGSNCSPAGNIQAIVKSLSSLQTLNPEIQVREDAAVTVCSFSNNLEHAGSVRSKKMLSSSSVHATPTKAWQHYDHNQRNASFLAPIHTSTFKKSSYSAKYKFFQDRKELPKCFREGRTWARAALVVGCRAALWVDATAD